MTALLEIEGLTVTSQRPERDIVADVSLTVRTGEVVALIGESGAGKTTVALAALGYTKPGTEIVSGSIRLNGVELRTLERSARQAIRGPIVAYVAQSAAASLNPSMSIGAQIVEGQIIHHICDTVDAKRRAQELLELLQLPAPGTIFRRFPRQMSGGQQQRVMMAIAMSCAPKLLVLDEPTTALDVTTQLEVLRAIKDAIRGENAAALYVSHDLAVVSQIASRIVVFKDGRIVEQGERSAIINNPQNEYTRSLLRAVRSVPVVGGYWEKSPTEITKESPLISIRNVSASYQRNFLNPRGAHQVIRKVDLDLAPGETLAIVGESGSGKSTLARVLTGLHRPSKGSITLRQKVLGHSTHRRTKEELRDIQIVFQSPEQALNPFQKVEEAIGRPLEFYFGIRANQKRSEVESLLEQVGLPSSFADKFPRELSGGQRQRVAIARALAAKPSVIVCDEFLSALDTLVASRMLELMAELQRSHSVAYFFISHDLATVAHISHRVAVMYAGQVVEIGRASEVFGQPAHPYTELLIRSVPQVQEGWLEQAVRYQPKIKQNISLSPNGCVFAGRCSYFQPGLCDRIPPVEQELGNGHTVFCHLPLTPKTRAVHPRAIMSS